MRHPPRHRTPAEVLATPLGRWGFTILALLATLTAQPGPALTTTVLALYAWRHRR